MTSTIPTTNGSRPTAPMCTAGPQPSGLQLLRRPEALAPAVPDVERQASPQLPGIPATVSATPAGLLSPEQAAALAAPLNRANVQTRSQAGRSLNYLEGWTSIRFGDTVGEPGPRQGHAQQQTTIDNQHRQGASRSANRRSGH